MYEDLKFYKIYNIIRYHILLYLSSWIKAKGKFNIILASICIILFKYIYKEYNEFHTPKLIVI